MGLQPGSCLETNLWVDDLGWSDQTEVALEGGIAAVVPVFVPQLSVKIGAADIRADDQAALDVDQLRLAQRGRLGALGIAAGMLAGQFVPDGVATESVLPGQIADAPAVVTKGFQFHVRFSRLHARSPAVA